MIPLKKSIFGSHYPQVLKQQTPTLANLNTEPPRKQRRHVRQSSGCGHISTLEVLLHVNGQWTDGILFDKPENPQVVVVGDCQMDNRQTDEW